MSILKKIFKRRSKKRPIFMNQNERYAAHEVGDWTYGRPAVLSWNDETTLKIGKFCSIADGVTILLGGEHNTDWVSTYPFNVLFEKGKGITGHPKTKGNIVIGNDVWIAKDAVILSGVTIGDGAVIGTRSVVTKNVAPYSVTAGNPARHVRFRFDEKTIGKLQKIAWWDWPVEKIEEAIPLLMSTDAEAFVRKYAGPKHEQ